MIGGKTFFTTAGFSYWYAEGTVCNIASCKYIYQWHQILPTHVWVLPRRVKNSMETLFWYAPLLHVQTWYDEIVTALDHCARPQQNTFEDIQRFFMRDNNMVNVPRTITTISRSMAGVAVSIKNKIQSNFFMSLFPALVP